MSVVRTYETFNQLKELLSYNSAIKNRILLGAVYARLCHVEGRIGRLKHDEIHDINTKALARKLMTEVVEFRTKYYKDKLTERVGNTSEDGMARVEREIEQQVRREELLKELAALDHAHICENTSIGMLDSNNNGCISISFQIRRINSNF